MTKWSVETLNERVDEELTALPLDMRGRFVRVSLLIEEFGPFNVGMPHIRGLDGKLWEIRVSGRDGIGRGYLYRGLRSTSCCFACLHQEDPKNA
jgi:hypothetical protein